MSKKRVAKVSNKVYCKDCRYRVFAMQYYSCGPGPSIDGMEHYCYHPALEHTCHSPIKGKYVISAECKTANKNCDCKHFKEGAPITVLPVFVKGYSDYYLCDTWEQANEMYQRGLTK